MSDSVGPNPGKGAVGSIRSAGVGAGGQTLSIRANSDQVSLGQVEFVA